MKQLTIPIALVMSLVTGFVGYGKLQEAVADNEEDIAKVEERQEKIQEYMLEQRDMNTEQKVKLETILEILKDMKRTERNRSL